MSERAWKFFDNDDELYEDDYLNEKDLETVIGKDIEFGKSKIAPLSISKGEKIKNWPIRTLAKGMHQISWYGIDGKGALVASGIYLYKIEADGAFQTGKMLLLK